MNLSTGPIFTIDYGAQLARRILEINLRYLDALERVAGDYQVPRGHTSVAMTAVHRRWNDEIATACRDIMAHMSQTVSAYQQIAADAVSALPIRAAITEADKAAAFVAKDGVIG